MVTHIPLFEIQTQFGERLRELRLATELTQEELAHRAGVDRTYVSSCERGRRNLSLEAIVKFATALGVPPNELLQGLGESKRKKP